MQPTSYARHRFQPEVIRHALWLYLRFTLSDRDVEELPAERGLDVSYETVRRWLAKYGPVYARNLRQLRRLPSDVWHLNEMVISIRGRCMYLWRAVDNEGDILDLLLQPRRDKAAALICAPAPRRTRRPCRRSSRTAPSQHLQRPDRGSRRQMERRREPKGVLVQPD